MYLIHYDDYIIFLFSRNAFIQNKKTGRIYCVSEPVITKFMHTEVINWGLSKTIGPNIISLDSNCVYLKY